jgi:hypothetical protein
LPILISRSVVLSTLLTASALEAPGHDDQAPSTIRLEAGTRNWEVLETTNFRVKFGAGDEALARHVAEAAERTRGELYRIWFGRMKQAEWQPACDVFLHRSKRSFADATEHRTTSVGYASTQLRAGRVVAQRIDLLADGTDIVRTVLPHEITHAVMADYFVRRPLPVWADEGIAVLAESPEKRLAHARNLERFRHRGGLYSARQLMTMAEYPSQDQLGKFYAQSVDLVEFLVHRKGTAAFLEFVAAAQRNGYDAELKRVYGFSTFSELDEVWSRGRSEPLAAQTAVRASGDGEQ